MNQADYQAIAGGIDAIAESRARRAATKRQIDEDARRAQKDKDEAELRRAVLKRQQEQDALMAGDREELRRIAREQIEQRQQAAAAAADPSHPVNQHRAAQTQLAQAQAAALAQKPVTPLGAELRGVDEFAEALTAATTEFAQAKAAVEAGDQSAVPLLVKAQARLKGMEEVGKRMIAKPQRPTSVVKLRRTTKSNDDREDNLEELEVPAEEWNEKHPMWARFNPKPPEQPPPVQIPASFEGKILTGPDGKRYRVKNGTPVPLQ